MRMLLGLALLNLAFCLFGAEAGSLLSPIEGVKRNLKCCEGKYVLSCSTMMLHSSALGDASLELTPLQLTLQFDGMVGGSSNSYHYTSSEAEAVMTYSSKNDDIYGHVALFNGKSFAIEYCGNSVHALKEMDVGAMRKDRSPPPMKADSTPSKRLSLDTRADDNTTVVTYSTKIYYSEGVSNAVADMDNYLDQLVAEVNQGYINSEAPVRMSLLCSEKAVGEFDDIESPLNLFTAYKGTAEALRGSADTTFILSTGSSWCGQAWFNTISSGETVGYTDYGCALGDYTVGHEVGHNIGLHHNKEENDNSAYPHGSGQLIDATDGSGNGFATILAYTRQTHPIQINWYSNPDVNFPTTGTPTGVRGTSNNVAVLIETRFALAAIGDESESCSGTTITAPSSCGVEDGKQTFKQLRYRKKMNQKSCIKKCKGNKACVGWTYKSMRCYYFKATTAADTGAWYGPKAGVSSCAIKKDKCQYKNRRIRIKSSAPVDSASPADCETLCKENSNCTNWAWKDSTCTMKEMLFYKKKGFRSGPRFC